MITDVYDLLLIFACIYVTVSYLVHLYLDAISQTSYGNEIG